MNDCYAATAITSGPLFHFKPYYDMQPWNYSGELFLAMQSAFQDRPPAAGDALTLGVVELATRQFHPIASTRAWNFQQGCMPHWQNSGPDQNLVVYNDIVDDQPRSVIVNVSDGRRRILSRPIQAMSHDGCRAAGLNFARWADWRPGYGYAGIKDPYSGTNQPGEDDVYLIDFENDQVRSLVSQEQLIALFPQLDPRRGAPSWFCHLLFSPDGRRLIGLMRMWCPELVDHVHAERTNQKVNIDGAVPARRHCLWMVNTDGSGLTILVLDGLVSHAEWRDPDHLLFWGSTRIEDEPGYVLLNVVTGQSTIVGPGSLIQDGHMSYHRNKRWLLTDTYPDENHIRTLKVFDTATESEIILGRFYAPPDLKGELRCDLHPCWSRDYKQVAIDSIHDKGDRQVYIVEVEDLNSPKQPLLHMLTQSPQGRE